MLTWIVLRGFVMSQNARDANCRYKLFSSGITFLFRALFQWCHLTLAAWTGSWYSLNLWYWHHFSSVSHFHCLTGEIKLHNYDICRCSFPQTSTLTDPRLRIARVPVSRCRKKSDTLNFSFWHCVWMIYIYIFVLTHFLSFVLIMIVVYPVSWNHALITDRMV